MFLFRRKPWLPPVNTGPSSYADWTEEEISYVSQAMRAHGQPEQDGFRRFARVALNTMRGGSAVELVARAIEEAANPGRNYADRPVEGSHYMCGMPQWCVWVEYARPAVAAIIAKARQDYLAERAR